MNNNPGILGAGNDSVFEPLNDGGKRGSGEITQIMYLPRCSMIALLSNNVISIVQSFDLSSVQEIKTKHKVHLFCVNNAVYQSDQSTAISRKGQPLMDQLCVVTQDRSLIFYEFQGQSTSYKFEEDKSVGGGNVFNVGTYLPTHILWDNDIIYMASKK